MVQCSMKRKKHEPQEPWERKIIHVDMDAFFASVEQLDHPEYRGKPIVVGGDPFGRGVVSTASYEARQFGIHSAMPAAHARRLCPQAIFVHPRFHRYREISDTVMAILHQHTDLVECVSVDEAYLDVTAHKLQLNDPVVIASMIKQSIHAVTQLTASAGVAPNMFLAKIASDFKKPDGLTVIRPEEVEAFLTPLPLRKIPGVGPVTEKELKEEGFHTCGDLLFAGKTRLYERFGKWGLALYERASGKDDREVEPEGESKQYSMEETFVRDTRDMKWMEERLAEYAQEIFLGLKAEGRMGKTVVLKIKYHNFEQITRSKTLSQEPSRWEDVFEIARGLLRQKTQAGKIPVRLLGLGLSGLASIQSSEKRQPELFEFGSQASNENDVKSKGTFHP